MALIKFSKPSVAVIKNKRSFFENNSLHLDYVKSVNALYLKQPLRLECKTCNEPLQDAQLFVHEVPYSICNTCGHFNGHHQDTEEFAKYVYEEDQGEDYARNYRNNFFDRVADIYIPKVDFLKEVMKAEDNENYSITDIGCGGGHFVSACEKRNIQCVGYDTNETLIHLGNSHLSSNILKRSKLKSINQVIKSVDTSVMCLIGVLEHLMDPIGAIDSFTKSSAKYLYLQVPLFSFSVILESANRDVFPRQLNAGHTHLYTEASLNYLCKKFKLDIAGAWWFGTDMVDLYRHLLIKSDIEQSCIDDIIQKNIGLIIDDLQTVFDSKKICSGVNMVLRKK
jgi:hypothetical protein